MPKPLSIEDGSTKSKCFQDCLNEEECTFLGRHSLHKSKHAEKRYSKHFSFSGVEETSKGGASEKSSHGNSLSSKCQGSTRTPDSDEQRDRSACKRKFAVEKTDGDHKVFNTRESCKTSASKHLLKQKEKELVEKLCPRLEDSELKAKRKYYKDEEGASVKDSSSNALKNIKSVSDRTSDTLSDPSTSSLPPNYKIPKLVQSNVADCHKNVASKHLKQRNKSPNLEASVSSSITLTEAHRCLDAAPSHVSDRREKKSSLSDQLPSASHSDSQLWCDEVSENTPSFFQKEDIFSDLVRCFVKVLYFFVLHCLRWVPVLCCDSQMQVVEELHLARSEKRLEVDVSHSCGELTCMDIDPPEEGTAHLHCKRCGFFFLEVAI